MNKLLSIASLAALVIATPALAQDSEKPEYPSPNAIVDAAPASDWVKIAPSDLLVMDLAPDADGNARRVVIQLMPEPFSQGWIRNIRKLAAAHWWDGTSINRVQDNYVVQWGDASEKKVVPEGLETVPESEYVVGGDTLSEFSGPIRTNARDPREESKLQEFLQLARDPKRSEKQHLEAIENALKIVGLMPNGERTGAEQIALLSIESTQTEITSQGWHERDGHAKWVEFWQGWPLGNFMKSTWENEAGEPVDRPANTQGHILEKQRVYQQVEKNDFWPVHCYGAVGVGRNYSPDTGSGAELYTVIGHAPRHLDRNIAVVGRIIEGIEHLSSLPRGKGQLGFYTDASKRVPITSIRLGDTLPRGSTLAFEYLDTKSISFAKYTVARTNRRDPFFIKPAGGADICNIPVPVRRIKGE